MENKRKLVLAVAAVFLLILAVIYFFPRPLESRLDAPLDENSVIYIDYREIIFKTGPNEIVSYRAECDAEKGLIDEAIELFSGVKTVSNPVNLLPWNISKWDAYDIKIAIGRPDNTGEWMNIGEKEMLLSKGEFKIYWITNRDFAEKIIEFTKENGTIE